MATKVLLTLAEKIDRAKEGRSQKYIVTKMNEMGCEITEVQFSRKKSGADDFTALEIITLSKILDTELV